MTMRRSLLLTALIVMLFGVVAIPSQADTNFYPGTWNGWWIFVSPSSQTANDGCANDGYVESPGQTTVVYTFINGAGLDLVARGYRVRLGTDSSRWDRIASSDSLWSSVSPNMRHVALHSNATDPAYWQCSGTYNYNATTTGTDVYHYSSSSNGHTLSYWINERLKGTSPGTGGGYESSLHGSYDELVYTDAPAVIVEEAYHTFKPDVDFLKTPSTWGSSSGWAWRMGYGVDTALGYP